MRKLKSFALAAAVITALVAFAAATASATELYTEGAEGSEENNGMVVTGTTLAASAEGTTTLHPPFGDITCSGSEVEGTTSNTGGATETVSGNISKLTFTGCNATVTVITKGSLEIHETTSEEDGTLTSNGSEVTVEFIGTHCIFKTSNTDIGTVTGSGTTEGSATLDIAATIPRTGGRSGAFCGSTAQWTGSYKLTKPKWLGVGRVCIPFPSTFGRYTTRADCRATKNQEPEKGSWRRWPK